MPGLLIMNHSGADARDGESRKRTHDGKLVNGERSPRNDAPTADGPTNVSSMNGAVAPVSGSMALTPEQLAELPPEIAHLTSEHYHPLTKLLQRVSQECFTDLSDVLQKMAAIQVNQHPNGVLTNGLGGHANGFPDNFEANKQKKLLLMRFAQESRAKFIKLLVLTEWGKKSSAEISRVIDIFQWTRDQSVAMNAADVQLLDIKELAAPAKHKNPDIRTALEVLSKGKAEWIPDLGYIPPEPISSEKALKLLRYINTSLAIRLNVHENLPRHLRKWRIASGRATFVVDSEFELDVMSFSEDASEQWYFVDLRLLFTPAPTIALGSRFEGVFKPVLDRILLQSGLSGCFDYLHNFILTHKIAILKSQAYQLAQAGWVGSIKVEPVHRSLVIQYWMDKPGRKSWVEIGMSSCKPKNGKISWRGAPISSLSARWFRQGVEVKDAELKFDFKNLSMERILKQVVALHVGHLLRTCQDAIPPKMTAEATLSETEPCDCTLEVSLGREENKTTLCFEPITGRYVLRPCTSISARFEQAINHSKDPLASISPNITQLLAQTLQDLIQRHAQQLSWQPQGRSALRMDVIKQATKLDVLQFSLYWPRGWTTKWALAAIIDTTGETWWCIELGGSRTTIEYAEQLKIEKTGPSAPISRATLSSLERIAVQQLAVCVTRRELQKQDLPGSVQTELAAPSSSQPTATPQSALRGWVLHLRTADLLVSKPGDEPWLDPFVRVMCQGFKADYHNIYHIASGTMVKSVAADMQKLMSASPQSNFTFAENGTFSILLDTPFGEPVIDELKARLRDVDRLRSFTTTLQKRKMKLRSSSLREVQFQYGQNNTATVSFEHESEIKVKFGVANPHNRIGKYLADVINEKSPFSLPGAESTGLDRFCKTLLITRPLLSTLTELETAIPGNLHNPSVYAHHVGDYRLTYANPLCSFDVRVKHKDDKVSWLIEDNDKKQPDSRPGPERNPNHKRLETLKTALATLFRGRGDGWYGIRSGIIADIDGTPDALRALHRAVLSCALEGGYPTPADSGAVARSTHGGGAAPPNNNNSTGPTPPNNTNRPVTSSNSNRPAPPNNNTRPTAPNNGNRTALPNINNRPTQSTNRPNFPNVGKHANGNKQDPISID